MNLEEAIGNRRAKIAELNAFGNKLMGRYQVGDLTKDQHNAQQSELCTEIRAIQLGIEAMERLEELRQCTAIDFDDVLRRLPSEEE